ncbi:MAG TPA: pre-peptidase C-terminal domain-containing protein [Kofleriaceae bacterium]|nr:pre-peptidase C-terminal domain-containing protein [Kofleriaceae bacterium]
MTTTRLFAGFILGASLVTGCVDTGSDKPDQSDVKGGPDGKAEAWGSSDNPAMFNSNLEYRVSALPATGEAHNIPWAGNYWPVYEDSINNKWAGPGSKAPSTKYGQAFGVTGVEDAVSQYHGIDAQSDRTACTTDSQCNSTLGEACSKREGQTSGRCIPTWWGICHAWSPAAILLPEPKHAVTYNGVDFKVQDIKALLTLVHDRTNTKFVSLRCDKLDNGTDINFDKYGRPNTSSAECRDTNPGTFHVLMTNYLGKQGEAFVYDRTWDSEVWNQPLRGYRITEQTEVSALDANKLIGVTAEGGTTTDKSGSVTQGATVQVGTFPVQAGQIFTVAMSGTGDPDMYVKFGSQPTTSSYDCRPYVEGAAETCTLTVPAGQTQAFVSVNGYSASTYAMKVTVGGSIPTTYVFNANAAKLYKAHMDVDYIGESAASTDGNLGATINTYTHQDHYDYILEVDSAGKIIGGEWIGESKRKHPDFVWLPISVGGTSVAGGKITYANVKMIYDLSMQDQNGGGGNTGTVKTVTDSATVAKAVWKQYGPYNLAAGATLTAAMTGDNDADLYVRKGAAPTAALYDCRPYRNGSEEQCSIVGPAQVYVGVNGYAASSSYSLTIKYTEGGGTTPPSPPPATFTHLSTTGSVAQGEMKVFQLAMPAGKKVVVRTTSTKDVDLYIQFGAAPTTDAYLNRGYTTSGNETISYTATSSGTLFIGVHGYEAAQFSVRTADQ